IPIFGKGAAQRGGVAIVRDWAVRPPGIREASPGTTDHWGTSTGRTLEGRSVPEVLIEHGTSLDPGLDLSRFGEEVHLKDPLPEVAFVQPDPQYVLIE